MGPNRVGRLAGRLLGPARRWLPSRAPRPELSPPLGAVDFGDLRRTTPISPHWGTERGRPIDRYYIEDFLARHAIHIRGRALEIGNDYYTHRFGGDRVARRDVLNIRDDAPGTTIVADLAGAPHIPSDTFDCIIFTQTLQLIYDVRAALRTLHRILKPGGVLLATFPGISQTYDRDWSTSWFWSFTPQSAARLFEEAFAGGAFEIHTHGNVLAAAAFLYGLAVEELRRDELDVNDPGYVVSITVRATKGAASGQYPTPSGASMPGRTMPGGSDA